MCMLVHACIFASSQPVLVRTAHGLGSLHKAIMADAFLSMLSTADDPPQQLNIRIAAGWTAAMERPCIMLKLVLMQLHFPMCTAMSSSPDDVLKRFMPAGAR